LEIAKNIGIDYHAATAELYYYMRIKDQDTIFKFMRLINGQVERGNVIAASLLKIKKENEHMIR
jgi:hypothetical protein